MIRFTLSCDKGHMFESWFASGAACDTLLASALVACVECGSSKLSKAPMAPALRKDRGKSGAQGEPILTQPSSELERALAVMRQHVEQNSEYVGMNFAAEARAIHDGDAPERAIWGEAHRDDAKKLLEDGVPVAQLPFVPTRRVN
jgi:hypothetical protein